MFRIFPRSQFYAHKTGIFLKPTGIFTQSQRPSALISYTYIRVDIAMINDDKSLPRAFVEISAGLPAFVHAENSQVIDYCTETLKKEGRK
jgi:hypothetical protein